MGGYYFSLYEMYSVRVRTILIGLFYFLQLLWSRRQELFIKKLCGFFSLTMVEFVLVIHREHTINTNWRINMGDCITGSL